VNTKTRVSVTLTRPYVKAHVVEKVDAWIDEELRGMGLPPLQEEIQIC